MPPIIQKKKCVNCGLCVEICPLDVIKVIKDGDTPIVKYPDECWHCRACAIDCPKGAIKIRYPLSHYMLRSDGTYESDNEDVGR